MRMEDSLVSAEMPPPVAPEATSAGAGGGVVPAAAAGVVKGGTGVGSLAGAPTPPPVPEEKLHGKDLLEALKKQVGSPGCVAPVCVRLSITRYAQHAGMAVYEGMGLLCNFSV